ncbi:MAG: DUF5615 family PIN-like protein [Rhodothermales bacterium]
MRLLADENVPAVVVEALRQSGLDVVHITETAPGILDPQVLQQAGAEARLLITADRDFGTLIFGEWQDAPAGVLYVRMGTASPQAVADAVLDVVQSPERELMGYFSTVQPGRVRQRPLPPR